MGTKESWEILQEAIPRGKRAMLAGLLDVCPDLICKWGREPLGDENLSGTGARNPIDRVETIYSFLNNLLFTTFLISNFIFISTYVRTL